MNNERIAVPEVLFRPADIGEWANIDVRCRHLRLFIPCSLWFTFPSGLEQCGVVEMAAKSVERCPASVRVGVASTVVLVGGTTCLPGFEERLYVLWSQHTIYVSHAHVTCRCGAVRVLACSAVCLSAGANSEPACQMILTAQ